MIRVILVDDQPMYREGLRSLLTRHADIEIVGEAANGDEAIALAGRTAPDVILMDIRMPRTDGVTATKEILSLRPQTRVLALTTFEDDDALRSLVQAGAAGYVLKDTPADDIAALVRMAHKGYTQFSSHIAAKLSVAPMPVPTKQLSTREQEVLSALGEGLTNREIAERLCVTEGTVRNYVSNVLGRLGLRNRMEAALYANGLRENHRLS